MTLKQTALLLGMGLTIIGFQNCAPVKMSAVGAEAGGVLDAGSEIPGTNTSDQPSSNNDNVDDIVTSLPVDESKAPLDATCKTLLSGVPAIAYDSIAPGGAAEQNFAIQASNQDINYETVGVISNGAAQSISVKARSIAEVRSFSASKVLLNAFSIGKVSSFSASQVVTASHTLDEVSNFAAKLCISAQEINSLHDLAADLSVFGRSEGGQKAKLKELKQMAAYASFHDVDIEKIESGSLRLRLENGSIGSLSAGSGHIYLFDSTIEKIENFSGSIHLYGTSKVGATSSSSVRIVQH
ncbi:MAG: hypothetical protein J7501_14820 [Bdellovibrio sp.]|nr:hypothetical protein [Bdellovibrio sp.]